jgi:hypothetical protein
VRRVSLSHAFAEALESHEVLYIFLFYGALLEKVMHPFLRKHSAAIAAALVLTALAMASGAWILTRLVRGAAPAAGGDPTTEALGDVGCPVSFVGGGGAGGAGGSGGSDGSGGRGPEGDRRRGCFQLGAYEDLREAVSSEGAFEILGYNVRPGYVVRCFERPGFQGMTLLNRTGPATKTVSADAAIPFPGSMVVSFRRRRS